MRRLRLIVPWAALATLPVVLGPYPVSLVTRIIAFALLALSVGLLAGYAGLPSLAHAAFFGVGAVTALHVGGFAPFQLVAAVVAGGAAAAATGWLAVRARGVPFIMITLAIGVLLYELALATPRLTGGSDGLIGGAISLGEGPAQPSLVYWYVLVVATLVLAALSRLVRASFGLVLYGLRDDEGRMRALGYSVIKEKYVAFCLTGAVAGAAGSLWVADTRFFTPGDMGFDVAVLALLSVVLVRPGTLWGPCAGAAAVLFVRDHLSAYIAGQGPLLLGLAFIAAIHLRRFSVLPTPRAPSPGKRRPAVRIGGGRVGRFALRAVRLAPGDHRPERRG